MSTATATPPAGKIGQVRKLLAKAEAFGTTEAESEALTAKAAQLMARHGIEKHMLAAAEAAAAPVRPGSVTVDVDPPFHHQKKDLLSRVADAMRLRPVIHHNDSKHPGQYRESLAVELFGSPADIDRCRLLYESLLVQATRLLRYDMPAGAKSAYKQSWLNGFALRVASRVREAEKNAVVWYDTEHALTAEHSSALVLASWDEQVVAYRAQLYPRLGKGKARSSSGNGFGAGWAAGDRAQITQRGLSGAGQRAIA